MALPGTPGQRISDLCNGNHITQKELTEKIGVAKEFRGNVYVVQDGRVLYESVTGFADLANEIPNTLETRFASASAGKVFVAVGILQLIEQGKLRFDDMVIMFGRK